MDRQQFFSRKPPTKSVTLESDGSTWTIRKLSEAAVQKLIRDYQKPEKALAGFRYVVSQGASDEDGTRLFSDADLEKLAESDFDVIKELAAEIADFSGLSGVETDPKKS